MVPSFGAAKLNNFSRNDPMRVLVALTITTSFSFILELLDCPKSFFRFMKK